MRKQRAYVKLVELETKWLNEAIAARNKPGLTRKRYQELDADIMRRKQVLEELQRENTKIH